MNKAGGRRGEGRGDRGGAPQTHIKPLTSAGRGGAERKQERRSLRGPSPRAGQFKFTKCWTACTIREEHHNQLQRPAAVHGNSAGAEGSPGGNEDAGGWLRWSLAQAIAVGSDRSFQELRENFPLDASETWNASRRAPLSTTPPPVACMVPLPTFFSIHGDGRRGERPGLPMVSSPVSRSSGRGGVNTAARGTPPAGVCSPPVVRAPAFRHRRRSTDNASPCHDTVGGGCICPGPSA